MLECLGRTVPLHCTDADLQTRLTEILWAPRVPARGNLCAHATKGRRVKEIGGQAREISARGRYKRPEGQSCFRFHSRPNFPTPIAVCPATLSPHSRSPSVFSTTVLLPTTIQMASKAAQKRVSRPASAGAGFPLITPPHFSVTAVPPALSAAQLSKEYIAMQKEPPPFVWAVPDEKNILTCAFVSDIRFTPADTRRLHVDRELHSRTSTLVRYAS